MIILAIAAALTVASQAATGSTDGISVAKRLAAAIKGSVDFQDSDFVQPLSANGKSALRRFASCQVGEIEYWLKPDPTERDTYVANPDRVLVQWQCKGVSSATPAALSIHLRDGKIATVATHNADLMGTR